MKSNKKHGGARPGAGRPPNSHKTKKISFRIREDFEQPVRDAVKEKVKQLTDGC